MNYIKHLNHWFEIMRTKEEVKPTHISLYLALFYLWNQNRFSPSFSINRQEMMNISKIGGYTTYSKCMRELHVWGWINYFPSTSKYGLSVVSLTPLDNTSTTLDLPERKAAKKPTRSTTADTSTNTTTDTRTKQEGGHSIKEESIQEKKQIILPHLKNKFHEPL